jgi:hypothetical protein
MDIYNSVFEDGGAVRVAKIPETGAKACNNVKIANLNPLIDTPVDVLHTIYLGCVKHFLVDFIGEVTEIQRNKATHFINTRTTIKGN